MGIARKISDAAQYMAEVPKNSWTIGSLIPAITNGEFRPNVLPMNRAARIVERGIFVAGLAIAVAGCVVETSVFPALLIMPLTKLTGFAVGGLTHIAAEKTANVAHSFERMVTKVGLKLGVKPKPSAPKKQKPEKAVGAEKAASSKKAGKPRTPREHRTLHKFAKVMDWMNDYGTNKYTLGDIGRRLLGGGPSENVGYTRIGRFGERVGTLGAVAALLIIGGPPVNIGFVVLLAGCKAVGMATGLATMQSSRFIGGMAHAIDTRLNRPRPEDNAVGARLDELAKKMAGARPTPQQQPAPTQTVANDITGASPLQQQFQQNAAKPLQGLAGSRIFSASGPRNAADYGLGDVTLESPITQAIKAAQQQQQRRV